MEKGGVNINYHNITYPDMNNGEGLRVVLWLSGCSHKCKGCQNPQTWNANSGIPFDELAKEELFRELDKDYISGLTLTGGDPLFESNLDGVLDLVTEVNKRYNTTQDTAYVKDKNNNILTDFNHEIRLSSPQKSIWLYTGYKVVSVDSEYERIVFDRGNEDIIQQFSFNSVINHNKRTDIASMCDVIVDGRYIDSQRDITLHYRGSSNQRVIDIKQSLQKSEIVLWQI